MSQNTQMVIVIIGLATALTIHIGYAVSEEEPPTAQEVIGSQILLNQSAYAVKAVERNSKQKEVDVLSSEMVELARITANLRTVKADFQTGEKPSN